MQTDKLSHEFFDYWSNFYKRTLKDDIQLNAVFIEGLNGIYDRLANLMEDGRSYNEKNSRISFKVCYLLLSRISFDLRSITVLIQMGHYMAAASAATTLMELAWLVPYIGGDEERAMEWASHQDDRNVAFGNFYNYLNSYLASSLSDDVTRQEVLDRIYRKYYRYLNEFKHGNTASVITSQFFEVNGESEIISTPHPEENSFMVSIMIVVSIMTSLDECIKCFSESHGFGGKNVSLEAYIHTSDKLWTDLKNCQRSVKDRSLDYLLIMDKIYKLPE